MAQSDKNDLFIIKQMIMEFVGRVEFQIDNLNKCGLLIGKQSILDYTGLSEFLYLKWMRQDMPVWYFDGAPYAHKENLDEFFKAKTRVSSKHLSDDIIAGVPEKPRAAKK